MTSGARKPDIASRDIPGVGSSILTTVREIFSKVSKGLPFLSATGVLVTAVPLTAIYTFDQNKNKFIFVTSRLGRSGDAQSDEAGETLKP